ncbi:hypothetical protein [Chryseobacterium sp. T1]
MFEYYNNTLCVKGNSLAELGVVTLSSLKVLTHRGKIKKARSARGLGSCALYVYSSLPDRFKNIIEHELGINPYEESSVIKFSDYLKSDETALAYFSNYELEDGRYLSEANSEAVEEYTANACVLNAIHSVIEKVIKANPRINKAELWEKLAKSVDNIDADLRSYYPFNLPTNPRALRAKYEACILEVPNERYKRPGLEGLIHDNWCNKNSQVITETIGKWLIVQYGMPVKRSIPEIHQIYENSRSLTGFPRLSESSIYNFLMKPENERIWKEEREGKDEYEKQFGHTIKKNKDVLFPNAHWAIDGTKLDAVYQDESGKMVADRNIDVVWDVHSETILGFSFSDTENHTDHFVALRMAVNKACAKPYLFTYDAQSGHRTKKMQELYSNVVATGGTHYHHKVGRKSNPAEGLFHRLQQFARSRFWFFDGQSIKSKQDLSKANFDFIKKYKKALPTREELYKHWLVLVNEWNNAKHSRYNKTRSEVYNTKSEFTQELDPLEQISMFWLNETKPKKYYPHGMPLTVGGIDYDFEVLDSEGNIDLEFRRKYVNTKLIVSYDPEYLDQYIKLYELNENGQKVFVAYAEKKREHIQIPKLLTEIGSEKMRQDLLVKEEERLRDNNTYQEFAKELGLSVEDLIDEQNERISDNNWELKAKLVAYGTKEEQIQTNRKVKIM